MPISPTMPISPIIKVCGMRNAENIRAVDGLPVDLMGFIFWPKSSRYVSERPSYLPTHCKRVGVFVDADILEIRQKTEEYALDYIQLHGHESPDFVRQLRSFYGDSIAIIKAISVSSSDDIDTYKPYEGLVDYFLFDTRKPHGETGGCFPPGGTGEKFDWSVLADYVGETPFLLSGGIGLDDAERVKALPALDGFPIEKCIGIDLNSRFEQAPGMKDVAKLQRFLAQLSQQTHSPHSPH